MQHEQIRNDIRDGRIGLPQNRLPVSADVKDVRAGDVVHATDPLPDDLRQRGLDALQNGELAVITLAAGSGSRWTQGAGVVKGLHPLCKFAGKHRTFIEAHLAKSRRIGRAAGMSIPHILTTSWLTHDAIDAFLTERQNYGYRGAIDALARPGHRPAPDPDAARPAVPLAGHARNSGSTNSNRRCATAFATP